MNKNNEGVELYGEVIQNNEGVELYGEVIQNNEER